MVLSVDLSVKTSFWLVCESLSVSLLTVSVFGKSSIKDMSILSILLLGMAKPNISSGSKKGSNPK